MERNDLIKLVADNAIEHLRYDDAHPDVGMGMGFNTAIDLAEKDVYNEAARWNSIEALRLDFDTIRDDVLSLVKERRKRKWL